MKLACGELWSTGAGTFPFHFCMLGLSPIQPVHFPVFYVDVRFFLLGQRIPGMMPSGGYDDLDNEGRPFGCNIHQTYVEPDVIGAFEIVFS